MSIKQIKVMPLLTDKQASQMAGVHLGENDYKILINYSADVYCEETGVCIAKFRRGAIPKKIQELAFKNLEKAAVQTDNRGVSGGGAEDGSTRKFRKLQDGKISKTSEAMNSVNSGIIGYFDSTPRFPYCRQTAFNQHQFSKFKKAYPIIKTVDNWYSKLMPDHYALQKDIASRTPKEFVITGTVFTTITVNMNWQTAVHTDKGDLTGSFGNLTALRAGKYEGGYFVVPKWGVAFDLQNGDLLLADVHQWHGNTPIKKIDPKAKRLSLVMYYRENMVKCDSVKEELIKAQLKSTERLKNLK